MLFCWRLWECATICTNISSHDCCLRLLPAYPDCISCLSQFRHSMNFTKQQEIFGRMLIQNDGCHAQVSVSTTSDGPSASGPSNLLKLPCELNKLIRGSNFPHDHPNVFQRAGDSSRNHLLYGILKGLSRGYRYQTYDSHTQEQRSGWTRTQLNQCPSP